MKIPVSGAPTGGTCCSWERLRSLPLQEKQRGRYFVRWYLLDLSYTRLTFRIGYR